MKSLNEKNYWSRLDHLRLYAALLVMAGHVWNFANGEADPHKVGAWVALIQQGHVGVSLFLVLTGYLFTSIFQDNAGRFVYGAFVRNRVLRILPLITVLFFILLAVGRKSFDGSTLFQLILMQLNTGDEVSGFGQNVFPVGSWWTAAVEFQFYLVFPFIMAFYRQNGLRYLLGLVAICITIRLGIFALKGDLYWNEYHTIVGRMDQFLIGMMAAAVHRSHRRFIDSYGALWLVMGIGLLVPFCIFHNDYLWFKVVLSFTVEGLIFALVLLGYQSFWKGMPDMLDRLLSKGGELTFSMYLLHPIVLAALWANFGFITVAQSLTVNVVFYLFVVLLPPVLLLSRLTFECIERPFMGLRTRYFVAADPPASV